MGIGGKKPADTVSLLHIISPASDTTSTHDIVLEDTEL